MHRRELIRYELDNLDTLTTEFKAKVEKSMAKLRKQDRCRLWLNKSDKYRLLTWRAWTIKYKVNVDYIVMKIVPFWEQFVQRRSKKMRKEGFNARVSTLTGKKSEEYLRDCIKKDYPNNEHIAIWNMNEKVKAVDLFNKWKNGETDGIKVRDRRTGVFGSIRRYVVMYRAKIKKARRANATMENTFKQRPYRLNPFKDTL